MKVLIVLLAVVACSLSASVPNVPADPVEQSLRISDGDAQLDEATSRIVRGHEALPNQIPYQVALRMVNPILNSWQTCGGVLISTEWVLSAAHCTYKKDTTIRMRFGSILFREGGIMQIAENVIIHPKFNWKDLTHKNWDISLLQIPSPLKISDAIRPIRLPTANQMSTTFVGQEVRGSGWGYNMTWGAIQPNLRYVDLRVISNAECEQAYPGYINDMTLCGTGLLDARPGFCTGDHGGPLVLNENGVPTLIAIGLFANWDNRGGCGGYFPTVFTRTTPFLTWIFENTGIMVRYK